MARLIFHAGMNKTGSSAIQRSIQKLDGQGVNYLEWKSNNHSVLFMLLFQSKELRDDYHVFRTQGWSREELNEEEKRWLEILRSQLERNRADAIVFSAEDASQPNVSEEPLRNFKEFFSPYVDSIEVIAYVRSPFSFATSAFQQRVKSGGLAKLDFESLWPDYRKRFENLDLVFGTENVTLVHFDSTELIGGDVVSDFIFRTGLPNHDSSLEDTDRAGFREESSQSEQNRKRQDSSRRVRQKTTKTKRKLTKLLSEVVASRVLSRPGSSNKRANKSLSLEALSLLFYQRKYGTGLQQGFRGATEANNAFIRELSTIGSTKFQLSHELVARITSENAADLNWIENRIGKVILDDVSDGSEGVSTEAELEEIALALLPDLMKSFVEHRRLSVPLKKQKLAAILDAYARLFHKD